ncbi:hypothetical protein DCC79_09025 [bacterium]|nr:MAG: hypothetical protein DCC79_09025 [bacterium]
MERRLGITRERPLPAPAREPLTAWLRRRGGSPPSTARGGAERRADGRRVALLPDTFNAYFTPAVAIAAVELFEAAGLAVVVPRVGCCGRPLLSHGRVAAARAAARAMVDALSPLAAAGVPIVGLEPSCVSMFGDEYAYLLPGDPAARAVADAASTFDAFVATRAGTGDVGWAFDGRPRRLLLHGHCHQQAREGTAAAHAALALPAGHRVEAVDAGCCGMAGAFGYEAEHHAVSLAMAEQRLLPAVRAAAPDDVIVAAGFSCRQQIAHATGRRAWHPAEVLRAALDA